MDRIIEVKVGGSYLTKDNKSWEGYAKKVTW